MAVMETGGIVDALRSLQSEQDRWHLADELADKIPSRQDAAAFEPVREAAGKAGVKVLSASSLRQYRDAGVKWPAADRVEGVSFTAHREALGVGSQAEAKEMLDDLVKSLGAAQITTTAVRQQIAARTGNVGAASTRASSGVSLSDLKQGGKKTIAAIPANTSPSDLDLLHAGLSKVLAHVEKLQSRASKAAAKAGAKASTGAVPAKTPAVAKAGKAGEAAADVEIGDLRDL